MASALPTSLNAFLFKTHQKVSAEDKPATLTAVQAVLQLLHEKAPAQLSPSEAFGALGTEEGEEDDEVYTRLFFKFFSSGF